MRNIENDLRFRTRKSIRRYKKTREGPLTNRYRVILTFFIIGCLATFVIAGVTDVYGAQGYSILPSPVPLGTVPVGGSADSPLITITNTGGDPFYILDVPKWAPPGRAWLQLKPGTDTCSGNTLYGGQKCTVMYTFLPYAVGDYDYQLNIQYTYDLFTHQNVNNLNVHMDGTGIKGTPTVSGWPTTGVGITYGQSLSACTLTGGGASVPGTFTFTYPNTVPNAGTNDFPVTFTPDDLINYNTVTGSVSVVVAKANAIINVTPYNVIYDGAAHTATGTATGVMGEVLSGLNLSGTTHTSADTYNDTWIFTDVTGNYNNASGTVNDVINKATPIITWTTPADITYPTALSNAQLNATANVPGGTFTYDPQACSVLQPGNNQDLWVSFTSDDPNYGTATANVKINVLEPNLTIAKVDNLWICTLSGTLPDGSNYPVAMYLCPSSDCSCMAGDPETNPNRCGNISVSDVVFNLGELKWVGGRSGAVDFVTNKTVGSQTSTIVYSCPEREDRCYSCGDGVPWQSSCTPDIPNSLDIPTVTTTTLEKIGDVWVFSEPDQSGCLTIISSCPVVEGQVTCSPVPWSLPFPPSQVSFSEGELQWTGAGSSGNANCGAVYFVTKKTAGTVIYKCISDTVAKTENCYSNFPP